MQRHLHHTESFRGRAVGGFTLIELLVVISIIALLIGILLPSLAAARTAARKLQSGTQLSGMGKALMAYAQGNNTWYPGLNAGGRPITSGFDSAVTPAEGTHPAVRYELMLDGGYFPAVYMWSPNDPWTQVMPTGSTGAMTGGGSYSYGLLGLGTVAAPISERAEWRDTLNTQAVIMIDRAIANGTGYKSVWSSPGANTTDWAGGVLWNDMHVTWESKATGFLTRYGATSTGDDELFVNLAEPQADAFIVFGDPTTAVSAE